MENKTYTFNNGIAYNKKYKAKNNSDDINEALKYEKFDDYKKNNPKGLCRRSFGIVKECKNILRRFFPIDLASRFTKDEYSDKELFDFDSEAEPIKRSPSLETLRSDDIEELADDSSEWASESASEDTL